MGDGGGEAERSFWGVAVGDGLGGVYKDDDNSYMLHTRTHAPQPWLLAHAP